VQEGRSGELKTESPIIRPRLGARSESRRRSLFGLVNRRERWGLSAWGWLVLVIMLLAFGIILPRLVYPFLAETHRVDAKILVVEGWVHGYSIRAAITEFNKGGYQKIFTTGGPAEGLGGYVNDFQTEASVAAELLKVAGVPAESLQMVPSRVMDRNRTYGSAAALRNWFREHHEPFPSMNVLTEDVHARRSRLLFDKAFGDIAAVGVISVPNPDYDSKHWWRYSAGVKDVVNETVGYAYAKLLFHPADISDEEKSR
jgi:uncharacterized SAM-binding protein YcdF (DUF218 family)